MINYLKLLLLGIFCLTISCSNTSKKSTNIQNQNSSVVSSESPVMTFDKNVHDFGTINEGETVSVGNAVLDVFLTPGHTPGHIIFFHGPSKLAIVGDVLFAGSIGRTDLPGGNYGQLIESIKTKLWPLGKDIAFVPGHGPPSNFKTERSTNPFVSDNNL